MTENGNKSNDPNICIIFSDYEKTNLLTKLYH